jgi:hypothetical protein
MDKTILEKTNRRFASGKKENKNDNKNKIR